LLGSPLSFQSFDAGLTSEELDFQFPLLGSLLDGSMMTQKFLRLSIPFVGFLLERLTAREFLVMIFQFPLLGSC